MFCKNFSLKIDRLKMLFHWKRLKYFIHISFRREERLRINRALPIFPDHNFIGQEPGTFGRLGIPGNLENCQYPEICLRFSPEKSRRVDVIFPTDVPKLDASELLLCCSYNGPSINEVTALRWRRSRIL